MRTADGWRDYELIDTSGGNGWSDGAAYGLSAPIPR